MNKFKYCWNASFIVVSRWNSKFNLFWFDLSNIIFITLLLLIKLFWETFWFWLIPKLPAWLLFPGLLLFRSWRYISKLPDFFFSSELLFSSRYLLKLELFWLLFPCLFFSSKYIVKLPFWSFKLLPLLLTFFIYFLFLLFYFFWIWIIFVKINNLIYYCL